MSLPPPPSRQISALAMALSANLARRVAKEGGAALLIDYGQDAPYTSSLQGIREHRQVPVSLPVNLPAQNLSTPSAPGILSASFLAPLAPFPPSSPVPCLSLYLPPPDPLPIPLLFPPPSLNPSFSLPSLYDTSTSPSPLLLCPWLLSPLFLCPPLLSSSLPLPCLLPLLRDKHLPLPSSPLLSSLSSCRVPLSFLCPSRASLLILCVPPFGPPFLPPLLCLLTMSSQT